MNARNVHMTSIETGVSIDLAGVGRSEKDEKEKCETRLQLVQVDILALTETIVRLAGISEFLDSLIRFKARCLIAIYVRHAEVTI
jgi:hypothetical protein